MKITVHREKELPGRLIEYAQDIDVLIEQPEAVDEM